MYKPRPQQEMIIQFQGGKMGVIAVPGSGKTHTLSWLASRLITDGLVQDDQEVLIVTMVNSAVNNFLGRIRGFLNETGFLPGIGYRVRTLHGLAHDIVRERPDLVGLSDQFQIIDERESENILKSASSAWIKANPDFILNYSDPEINPFSNYKVMNEWDSLAADIAQSIIRICKDRRISPFQLRQRLNNFGETIPILEMGYQVYLDYQQALSYRGAVDFDDLIRLALEALQNDPYYLERLRRQWPYILEDEAQDSSRLQEGILRQLVGENGNWVRVGDPNQAIFETFTTASPRYLVDFIHEPGVDYCPLSHSGRSNQSIINLANSLITWTREKHLNPALSNALNLPLIEPTPANDPQPNPPDKFDAVYISEKKYTPDQELAEVIKSIKKWLPEHKNQTIAVLVPRNERGARVVEELQRNHLDYLELLRSSQSSRQAAGALSSVLKALAFPTSPIFLAAAYLSVRTLQDRDEKAESIIKESALLIQECKFPEQYLWPSEEYDWLQMESMDKISEPILEELKFFKKRFKRWQSAILLPIDELMLIISQDIFNNPCDLALAHKIALNFKTLSRRQPDWQLENFQMELDSIAKSKQKIQGFSDDDTGFDPDKYPGKVVVATIHKAKGLEWDRVYLMSVNNYDFPSGFASDYYFSEKWFIKNKLNLQAEAMAKTTSLIENDHFSTMLEDGFATNQARIDYSSEKLRLFFVGITRARKEMIITWNTGRRGDAQAAVPLGALQNCWKEKINAATG